MRIDSQELYGPTRTNEFNVSTDRCLRRAIDLELGLDVPDLCQLTDHTFFVVARARQDLFRAVTV
jgi:hypothetical protein